MSHAFSNPNREVEEAIRLFVRTNPLNRLEAFGGAPIFDEPLIGFADGDDPIFVQYKKVVDEAHLMPREILAGYTGGGTDSATNPLPSPACVSVISFVLPIPKETRAGNAKETK